MSDLLSSNRQSNRHSGPCSEYSSPKDLDQAYSAKTAEFTNFLQVHRESKGKYLYESGSEL